MKSVSIVRALCLLVPMFACSDAAGTDPLVPQQLVVTSVSNEATISSTLIQIDGAAGRIVARRDLGGYLEGVTSSHDSSTFFAGTVNANGRRELVAINARTLAEQWRLVLSERLQPVATSGIGFRTGEVLSPSPDGRRLLVWRAEKDGVVGIASIDLVARQPVAFSGPWNIVAGNGAGRFIPPLPPAFPNGAIVIVAGRENASGGPIRTTAIFFLDPNTLAPIDSVSSETVWGAPVQPFWDAVASADGRELYVGGPTRVVRFDIATRQPVSSKTRLLTGSLAFTRAGGPLVHTDAGKWPDFPGTGLLHLYSAALDSIGAIDVSTALGGRPNSPTATVMGLAGADRDGRTLYVRTGTSAIGPLYPTQPARLLVVDLETRVVKHVVDLDGYGLGVMVVPAVAK